MISLFTHSLTPIFSQAQVQDIFRVFIHDNNFQALGDLINYTEAKQIDISGIQFSAFRTSLNPNVYENLLVFLKYYTYYFECLFRKYRIDHTQAQSEQKLDLNYYLAF